MQPQTVTKSNTAPALVLASASPSRRALLEAAGLTISVQPTFVDEAQIKTSLLKKRVSPDNIALALARAKGLAGTQKNPESVIIAADQILFCDDTLYDKPTNMDEARTHLKSLRGKSHTLIGATVLTRNNKEIWTHTDTATMTMRSFSDAFLDDYLVSAGTSILSSVGAYQLEDRGIQLFDAIEGGYFTILGLPILPLLSQLRAMGTIP